MEYAIGSLIALAIIVVGNKILKPYAKDLNRSVIRYSQSHVYSLIAPVLDYVPKDRIKINTQSSKFVEDSYIRVVIVESSAYWIKDQALYTADVSEGAVDKSTTRRVDTMAMDKVQLDKTLFIVEKLREGLNNDRGGTGK
jgi:hypothetical protein